MTKYFTIAILIALGGYGCIEIWPLVNGPSLSIISPTDNTSFPGGIVDISGKAARAAILTLNGEPVLHDQDGGFSSTLTFPRGSSILTFVATDRFGRMQTATRTIFVPSEPIASTQ